MEEAGIHEVDTYVSCHQNTVTQFNVTRPIMDLCLASECRPGPRLSKRRWEQDGMDVEEMRTACWEVELTEGEDDTDDMETETD